MSGCLNVEGNKKRRVVREVVGRIIKREEDISEREDLMNKIGPNGSRRLSDISHEKDLMDRIRQEGYKWVKIKTKDPEIFFEEQRDVKEKCTGNYKLVAKEYKTSKRIERYYRLAR